MTFHFNSKLCELDKELGGLETGKSYYVASTCGNEATALLNTIALSVAEKNNVLYLSLDKKAPKIFRELLSSETGIPYSDLRMNEPEIKEVISKFTSYQMRINDENYSDKQSLFRKLERYIGTGGARLIVIDRLDYADFFMGANFNEIDNLINDIRDFAKENDVCIITTLHIELPSDFPDTKIYLENLKTDKNSLLNVYINQKLIYTPLHFISECTKLVEEL